MKPDAIPAIQWGAIDMFKIFAILCATLGGDRQCQEYAYALASFTDKSECEAAIKKVSDEHSVGLYMRLVRSSAVADVPLEVSLPTVTFECRERPKGEEEV